MKVVRIANRTIKDFSKRLILILCKPFASECLILETENLKLVVNIYSGIRIFKP